MCIDYIGSVFISVFNEKERDRMILKFNKSKLKLIQSHKTYTGASEEYNSDKINCKAKELMNTNPNITRQSAYDKARQICNKGKNIGKKIKLAIHDETVRSLALAYKRTKGMSNRQAYRQACRQLAIN
ncbi:hypothetical protein [Fastidiosibacter lacustris]|uniref:hypothetical protein n=1 Tax=Fastidiosibacter lacustris TaxID=2056695 RepID=UPI0023D95C0A|nr:hypothetical protein [Fastidiosibacter lacustris]